MLNSPNHHLFRFCPKCGKKTLGSNNEKAFTCQVCQFKFYLNTAAAAIGVIQNKENHLLVTTRKYDPAKGTLDLPGGFVEPGESIENCLIREIKEELHIQVVRLNYFCSLPNYYIYKDVTYATADVAFFCTIESLDSMEPGDDISDCQFIPLSEIDNTLFGLDSARQVIQMLKEQSTAAPGT